jgi:hypothetical protein
MILGWMESTGRGSVLVEPIVMTTLSQLAFRLQRIHAAIGETVETDISKFPATVGKSERLILMSQDFRGGLSDERLTNLAVSLIHNVFNLRDHLVKWARAHGGRDQGGWDFFKGSMPLKIIADLSNVEKHGYPLERPSWSGLDPKLGEVTRPLSLTASPGAGWFVFTVGKGGEPTTIGKGEAKVVLRADVLDGNDNRIGDLVEIAENAVADWERLLAELGVAA